MLKEREAILQYEMQSGMQGLTEVELSWTKCRELLASTKKKVAHAAVALVFTDIITTPVSLKQALVKALLSNRLPLCLSLPLCNHKLHQLKETNSLQMLNLRKLLKLTKVLQLGLSLLILLPILSNSLGFLSFLFYLYFSYSAGLWLR